MRQQDHFLAMFKLLSLRERQHKRDKTKVQEDDLLIETALDFEEKCLKELNAIKLGERRLGADFDKLPKIDDTKTKFRNFDYVLDKKLILLVYEPDTSKWQLPKLEWSQNDLSLRMVCFLLARLLVFMSCFNKFR